MEVQRVSSSAFVLRFEHGEEVVQGLLRFAKKKKLKSAWVNGLGGFQETILGFYELKQKIYVKKTFKKLVELTCLMGNLTRLKKDYVLHAHATLADRSYKAFGGHLFRGVVSATCEVYITEISRIDRKMDKQIGLNLMQIR